MKHAILMLLLQLGSTGADAYLTQRNFQSRFPRELNTVARPFMGSTAGRCSYFSGTAGLKIAVPWILQKHGHPKLAEELRWAGIADSTAGAIISAKGHKD